MMTKMRRTLSEHDSQVAVIEWCRWHAVRYPCLAWIFAIPNGAKLPYTRSRNGTRYAPQALKLKAEGMLSGVADLFLPAAFGGYYGLFVEMKVGRNTPSEEQLAFIRYALSAGYQASVCYGTEEAVDTIANYIGVPVGERW
jgi:hypothetical protein